MKKRLLKFYSQVLVYPLVLMPVITSCGGQSNSTSDFNYVPSIPSSTFSSSGELAKEEYYTQVVENNQIFAQDFLAAKAAVLKEEYEEWQKKYSDIHYEFTISAKNIKIERATKSSQETLDLMVSGKLQLHVEADYTENNPPESDVDKRVWFFTTDYIYTLNNVEYRIDVYDLNSWHLFIEADSQKHGTWSIGFYVSEITKIYGYSENNISEVVNKTIHDGKAFDWEDMPPGQNPLLTFDSYYFKDVPIE